MNISAFILAAGLGERLRPITDHIPKPLLPVLGKPMLESVLEKVSALPAATIGINLHYKKELIERWIRQSAFSDKVTLFPEDPVLGTGGALKNAEGFLRDNAFLVHNADILSDIDLEKLIAFHKKSDNFATLAIHNCPEFNNLAIDENGYLTEIGAMCSLCRSPGSRLVAFTGIAVYAPSFLKVLPEGASSVVHAWTEAISSGQRIGTYDVTGCSWTDIGTPASYAKAVISELRNNGETVYIHPSVQSCKNVEMDGHVVIEQESELNKGLSLRNCIVLPGTIPETREPDNTEFKNCILGPGFTIDLGESEMLGGSDVKDALLIGTGGSDRRYYRVRKNDCQVVLMQSTGDDPDFQRSIEYTRFFRKYSVPVPELIDADAKKRQAFFEDLGDLSLYSWLKCPRDRQQIEEIYRRVLDMALMIHTTAGKNISACPLLKDRPFDYEHLRWETRYFLERFVKDIMHISIDDGAALDSEFHRLAEKVDSFPKTLIHRDFQSQNIMIVKGMTPRIIDYQGARIGPPAYDVASLLWDPYYRIEGTTRQRLIDYYSSRTDNETMQNAVLPCRLQRHMQALGAYGFLSAVKGKNYFLKYVPEGLRLLKEDITLARNDYPVLFGLIMKL